MDSMHIVKERHNGRDFRKTVMNFKISGQERIFDWIRKLTDSHERFHTVACYSEKEIACTF